MIQEEGTETALRDKPRCVFGGRLGRLGRLSSILFRKDSEYNGTYILYKHSNIKMDANFTTVPTQRAELLDSEADIV